MTTHVSTPNKKESQVSVISMRDIPGLEGRYLATEDGRIWSVARGAFRALSKQSDGYLTFTIRDRLSKKTITIKSHRAIAKAWIGNPNGCSQINHKDGDKTNNCISNLEWCSGSENMIHAWRTGLQPLTQRMISSARNACSASAEARRKLFPWMIEAAKIRVKNGELQKNIANELKISKSLLSRAINGKL